MENPDMMPTAADYANASAETAQARVAELEKRVKALEAAGRVETDRRVGAVQTLHPSPYRFGGSYGTILCDDGHVFVWDSGNVFRDTTAMRVGEVVSFRVVFYSYATDITSKGYRHRFQDAAPSR